MKKYLLILSTLLLIGGNISFADDGYDNAAPNLIYDTDSNEDDILMEPGSRKSISKGQKNNVPGNLNWDDLENNNEIYGRPATASLDDVNLDDFGDNNNDISGRPAITPNDKNVMERLDDETDMENFEYDTIPEGTPQGHLYGKGDYEPIEPGYDDSGRETTFDSEEI